jgi:hypothetical protein
MPSAATADAAAPPAWWDDPRRARRLGWIAWSLFALSLLLAVVTDRAFFGDGVRSFVVLLERRELFHFWPERRFAEYLLMWPVPLAIRLGITDVDLLRILFSIGCLLPWPLALWLCHRLAPRQAWLAVLAAGAGYLNTGFFVFGQYNVAQAFFMVVLLILLFARPLTALARVVLLLSCALLVLSYESLLFLGPIGATLALWRAWRGGEGNLDRAVLALAGLLLLAAGGVALGGVLHPSAPTNFESFLAYTRNLLLDPTWTLICTAALLLVLALLAALPAWRAHAGRSRAWPWLAVLAALAWALPPLLLADEMWPGLQFGYRAIALAVPLALVPLSLWLHRWPAQGMALRGLFLTFASLLLALQSLWQIGATVQWWGYRSLYKQVLSETLGPVPFSTTTLAGERAGFFTNNFNWGWTHPYLSIVWSRDGRVRSIIYQDVPPTWMAFDIFDRTQLPDLRSYDIRFGPYNAALKARQGG